MSLPLDFPHTASGEIDWKTLGNILSAHILGEVHCASYLDTAHGSVVEGRKNYIADTYWKFAYKEDDVVAFQKSFKNCPINAFIGRGVIDRPMDDIISLLETHERRKEWDRFIVDIKQVKAISEEDVILYMRMEATNCLIKQQREFIQYERMAYIGDKYVRSAVSVDLPEFPRKQNLIRGELLPGTGWVLEPYKGNRGVTLVSYLAHVDAKGAPPVILNKIMRRQPKAIHRMRKVLTSQGSKGSKRHTISPDRASDFFTVSEKKEVVAATMEYNSQHFEDDLPMEAFIGARRSSRFKSVPVQLEYDPGTDSFTSSNTSRNRSVSVDSDASVKTITAGSQTGRGISISTSTGATDALNGSTNIDGSSISTSTDTTDAVNGSTNIDAVNGSSISTSNDATDGFNGSTNTDGRSTSTNTTTTDTGLTITNGSSISTSNGTTDANNGGTDTDTESDDSTPVSFYTPQGSSADNTQDSCEWEEQDSNISIGGRKKEVNNSGD